ncbi:hypothetical protein BVRB_4g084260 [Beta vulgaris subsp. vulgaris]|nr:hypothetical protein BVRB_4g084260 [Beta vulgaris subsp. vulgaris]
MREKEEREVRERTLKETPPPPTHALTANSEPPTVVSAASPKAPEDAKDPVQLPPLRPPDHSFPPPPPPLPTAATIAQKILLVTENQ